LKVCIVGAGVVGSFLAKRLSREGYEIAVVDVDSSKLEQLSLSSDVLTVNCNALDVSCLKRVSDFELFIVVTESDEKNVAVTTLLRSLFKKEKVIFRVSNKALSSPPVKELLGAEPVNILSETVQKVMLAVKYPFAKEAIRLEGENLIIFKLEVTVESPLAGKELVELAPFRRELPFTVVAIEREGKVIIPKGEDFIYPKDKLYLAVKEEDALRLPELLKIPCQPTKLVFIIGFSQFTYELLTKLSELKGIKVKLFSESREEMEELSALFNRVDFFLGEPTDAELLREEGVDRADLVVALTEDEEVNILSSVLAKKMGAKRACALITHPAYEEIVESIGIDIPVAPRKVLASKVYRQLSKRKFLELLELSEKLDVVETLVEEETTVSESSRCGLIIAVKRNGETEIATGSTILKPGDKLICVVERK